MYLAEAQAQNSVILWVGIPPEPILPTKGATESIWAISPWRRAEREEAEQEEQEEEEAEQEEEDDDEGSQSRINRTVEI